MWTQCIMHPSSPPPGPSHCPLKFFTSSIFLVLHIFHCDLLTHWPLPILLLYIINFSPRVDLPRFVTKRLVLALALPSPRYQGAHVGPGPLLARAGPPPASLPSLVTDLLTDLKSQYFRDLTIYWPPCP